MRTWPIAVLLAVFGLSAGLFLAPGGPAAGADDKPKAPKRPGPKKKPIPNTESLDTRVSQTEEVFLRETESLIAEYFDAGHYDKAQTLLKKIEAVDPDRPGVKEKLKAIEDTVLKSNEVSVDVDAGDGWQATNVMLFKDQPIRVDVEGSYRFVVNAVISADGFADDNPDTTMIGNLRCGSLVGVIVGEAQGGKKTKTHFAIGKGRDSLSPPSTGILFLRVNAPQEAKCTGKLKVTLSGSLKTN